MSLHAQIKATRFELTPAIEDYILKKAAALEKLIPPTDTSARLFVEVGKTTAHHQSGNVFRAEFNLHIAGKQLYAVSERNDLHVALDEAKDDMMKALRSHKGRGLTLLRRGGQKIKDFMRGLYRK